MKHWLWLLNRLAATIAGCITLAVMAALVVALVDAVACGPTCVSIVGDEKGSHCAAYASTCGEFLGDFLAAIVWGTPSAMVLGVLPGAVALTLSPARRRPWQSLPFLVAGTLLGFGVWLALADALRLEYGPLEVALLFAIPSATGLATAFCLDRLRAFMRRSGAVIA